MTLQGPVTQWVTDHRKHHALSDQPGDPHSPHTHDGDTWMANVLGLWHAHVGWLFRTKGMERGDHYGRDLLRRPHDPPHRPPLLRVGGAARSGSRSRSAGRSAAATSRSACRRCCGAACCACSCSSTATWAVNSVCHRFGIARLRDARREPQQPRDRAADVRRGLAQQPPRVPVQRPPRAAARPVRPVRLGGAAARALAGDLGREAARRDRPRAAARARRLTPVRGTGASVRECRVECVRRSLPEERSWQQ